MTVGKLRKVPGAAPETGMYAASGTLEGVSPGRRVVRSLRVRRLDASSVDGLAPLAGFADLEYLELEYLTGVDLGPVADLPAGVTIDLRELRGVDLAPLAQLRSVDGLQLLNVGDDCGVPQELVLPRSLRSLMCVNDARGLSGGPIKGLVEAIDWAGLPDLRTLDAGVGGNEPLAAIELDLGFLRLLPNLERLDLTHGVWHDGRGPSPLQAPFEGLSRKLTWLRVDAWEPAPLKAQLTEYLGGRFVPTVYQRYGPQPAAASWTVHASSDGELWHTYGSLYDLFDGRAGEVEGDALKEARRRIRAVDRGLLARVDFDQESSGTGISAPSRADLDAVLAILGVDA